MQGAECLTRTKRYNFAALDIERRVGEREKTRELKRVNYSSIRPSLKAAFPFSLMDIAVGGFGGIGGEQE